MRPVRIVLTKGRLEKAVVELFDKIELDTSALKNKGRRLILPAPPYEVVLAKAPDVITYIEHGVCDVGVVGKDIIEEQGAGLYEMLDLGVGRCRFALAAQKSEIFENRLQPRTIASKYPNITRRFFEGKGMDVNIIKIEGSVELAPLLHLADGIVDIVETGSTLRENGLSIVEEFLPVSARVVVNVASLKLRKAEIEKLLGKLAEAVAGAED